MAKRNKTDGTTGVEYVKFVDNSAEVIRTMVYLSKAALRESGKVIRKKFRENIKNLGLVHSNRLKNYIATWAFVDNKTGQPQLWAGYYSWQKLKDRKGVKALSHASPYWIEFGTKEHEIPGKQKQGHFMAYEDNIFGYHVTNGGQKATHLLRDTVQNNIDEIYAAQREHLAELNYTLEKIGTKIFTDEEDEDD